MIAPFLLLCIFLAVAVSADEELKELNRLLNMPAVNRDKGFEYSADRFVDYVQGDSILLQGNAVVIHGGSRLEAAEMVYHRRLRLISARAAADSGDTVSARPTLTRGNDVLTGERIVYDMDSAEGVIADGRIRHDKGYYGGKTIFTQSQREFHVHSGYYTTCDQKSPHFDFFSPRIKVLVGDMAIARPVYFRTDERRLFWIPFYVFSLREDRQSGVLTPVYGRRSISFADTRTEWEIRNLGYYFAPSDYWDFTVAGDMRERSGWLTRATVSYAWRYHFDGKVETRFQNKQSGDRSSWEWWLSMRHRQDLGESISLRGSGTFQSNLDFQRDNSSGLRDRLDRTLRSNVRFDKRWREAGWSLSAGASQTRNLDTDRSDVVLPEVSLRSNRKSVFGGNSRRSSDSPWYTAIFYDGSAHVRNSRRTPWSGVTTELSTADASLRLSTQQRPVEWLNVNGSWSSAWRDADLRQSRHGEQAVRNDRIKATATLSQTAYGLFHPRIWRLTALRHMVKPDVGVSFAATRADTGGLGFSGRNSDWVASRRLIFRLANTFWAKVLRAENGEDDKVRVAQLNLSTSYDFDRDRRPLADLTTSLSVEAGHRLSSRLNLRSQFYDDRNRFQSIPRLDRLELNTSLRLTGTRSSRDRLDKDASPVTSSVPSSSRADNSRSSFGYESGLQRDIQQRARGGSLLLSHYISKSRGMSRHSWLRASAGASLAKHWHLHYSLSYNLSFPGVAPFHDDRITAELLSVQREFHDWTATLNLEPTTFARDGTFYFKAQFKDIPQIRLERGDRRRGS
ncbi:MAG: putative LPS assembly protein LptD [Candidatus Latescibacterota bacterium]|nr:putative LPS assembly protein LptD [Candidatus Latescibacterota bacterium]